MRIDRRWLLISLAPFACAPDRPTEPKVSPVVVALSVTAPNGMTADTITVGEQAQFTASLAYPGNHPRQITWTTKSAAVATVNAMGLVTGAGAGQTYIVATNKYAKDSARITVTAPPPPPPGTDTTVTIVADSFPTACLTARASSEGALVETRTCDGRATQNWVVNGGLAVKLAGTTLCLDDVSGAGTNYAHADVTTCSGATRQRWTFDGAKRIAGAFGACVDDESQLGTSGSLVIVYACHTNFNQRWRKVVGGAAPPPAPPPPPSGPLQVVPGLIGFGTTTPAGRGGAVIRVTNLNDAGAGSLRDALGAAGARTIVFDLSGTITLTSGKIAVTNPFVTVAGQTAPAPGIQIKGNGISVRTHDVLIQHLHIRPGDGTGAGNFDALEILGPNGYNVVADHLSLAWAMDENFSTWTDGAHDITLANSIVSEALNTSYAPSQGVLLGDLTKNVAVITTLMAHNSERNPYFKGGVTGVAVNNVMYNWSGSVGIYHADPEGSGATQAAWVGNVGVRGPDANTSNFMRVYASAKAGTQLYIADNSDTRTNNGVPPSDPWSLVQNDAGAFVVASSAPVWPAGLVALSSTNAYQQVLSYSGAWAVARDAVDARVVENVDARTGAIISSQAQVGGWPVYAVNLRVFQLPANPNGDDDGDGYTNLEELLHTYARGAQGQ